MKETITIKAKHWVNTLDLSLPCKIECNAPFLKRPHIGCITCIRREIFYKHNTAKKEDFIISDKFLILVERGNRGPLILPKKSSFVLLTINNNRTGLLAKLRDFLLHQLLSICETLSDF